MATLTPNMNLYLPQIGVDSGLTWEQDVNSNSSILDSHNHSPGSGLQINPSGLNINSDLSMGDNNLIAIRSARFQIQASPISGASDLACLYVSGVDLYFNDENSNQIQITSGGLVNATSSGISSGTASAAFAASILVVLSASNTPASLKCGSVLLGNTGVSGSGYVTLSPPGSTSNYNLVLPQIPGQTNVMTLDTSGNMSSITYDAVGSGMTSVGANAIAASMTGTGTTSIINTMGASGANAIGSNMTSSGANAVGASMTSTGANAVAASRSRASGSSSEGAGGVAISSSSGNYTTTSSSYVSVTNLSVTLTTSGRPVAIVVQPAQGTVGNFSNNSGTGREMFVKILNNTSSVDVGETCIASGPSGVTGLTPSGMSFIDTSVVGSANSYNYLVQVKTSGNSEAVGALNCVLVAYEL